jgi:hypothetical protein
MLSAGEVYRLIKAAGGDFIFDRNREVVEATGPSDVLDLLEENDVSPENLSAIVREHYTAVSVAEKFLHSIKPKPAKKPKAKKPKATSDLPLGDFAYRVLVALAQYKNRQGTCSPSMTMLCTDLGLPTDDWQTVRAALAELEAAGFITIEKRANTSNKYTILPVAPEKRVPLPPDLLAYAKERGL